MPSSRAQHWVLILALFLGWGWGRLGGDSLHWTRSFQSREHCVLTRTGIYLDVNLPFLPSNASAKNSEHLWIYRIHTFLTDTTVILLSIPVETATGHEFPMVLNQQVKKVTGLAGAIDAVIKERWVATAFGGNVGF